MAETETQAAGEVVRSPAHAHAVAIHFHVHAPPPPPPPPPPPLVKPKPESESESPSGSKSSPRHPLVGTGVRFLVKEPVRSSGTTTIQRIPETLRAAIDRDDFAAPIAVAIDPYHHGSPHLQEMEEAKKVARDEFCRVAGQDREVEVIQQKITSLAADAKRRYADDYRYRLGNGMEDDDGDDLAEIMFMDGCFLLRFMADVMLLENQLPWLVLQALMECTPGVSWPVAKFLDLMACAFNVGNEVVTVTPQQPDTDLQPPLHLLGLFHRRQVGAARAKNLDVPSLSSLSCTAVELAEMGVKITASKAKAFGHMAMTKRRPHLGLYGELALAPMVLNKLTACWLFNMVAYEASLGAACADNFAVSSYVSVVSLLMNQQEDVKELRGKGVVVSAFSDEMTLASFKNLAAHVRVGYRYYDVFEHLQQYRQERWVWIAVHAFLYRNLKTIIAVFSAIGVLAGLFKAILSLKHPQQG
ncbi:hypothetical protein U9M48_041654 [Paspalum notatum var. saurae]|uniref:Uncharacterized protein n=1 Tax=Paspalum notatum var. saurae TaxID=547442 RepID=A0AAQ3UP86_PASNO